METNHKHTKKKHSEFHTFLVAMCVLGMCQCMIVWVRLSSSVSVSGRICKSLRRNKDDINEMAQEIEQIVNDNER